ncbi:MAG: hypothetical protein ACR2J4_07035 [Deinococcus sp.]
MEETTAGGLNIVRGEHMIYRWIEVRDFELWSLTDLVPALVVGKRVAITSFDSGPLQLQPNERVEGWTERNDIALSPLIHDPTMIPSDNWDEWLRQC